MGTNLLTLRIIRDLTDLPLIQNCAVSKIHHFVEASQGGADAVAARSYFYSSIKTPCKLEVIQAILE